MIVIGVLFLVLFIAYIVSDSKRKKIELKKQQDLENAYAQETLGKMEYDVALYQESDKLGIVEEPVFGKIEDEDEELQGNYKP